MSTVHPEFNRETSRCKNCAAYMENTGECRRHAPRPRPMYVKILDEYENHTGSKDISEETTWPQAETAGDMDLAYCCEWLPRPAKRAGAK